MMRSVGRVVVGCLALVAGTSEAEQEAHQQRDTGREGEFPAADAALLPVRATAMAQGRDVEQLAILTGQLGSPLAACQALWGTSNRSNPSTTAGRGRP